LFQVKASKLVFRKTEEKSPILLAKFGISVVLNRNKLIIICCL